MFGIIMRDVSEEWGVWYQPLCCCAVVLLPLLSPQYDKSDWKLITCVGWGGLPAGGQQARPGSGGDHTVLHSGKLGGVTLVFGPQPLHLTTDWSLFNFSLYHYLTCHIWLIQKNSKTLTLWSTQSTGHRITHHTIDNQQAELSCPSSRTARH